MVSLLLSALILSTHAEKITTTVGTNNTDWSITRQSDSIKFDYSQYVQGSISPVEYRGRSLEPYHSSYEEVDVNDVRLRERTSARRGDYASEGVILLRADSANSSEFVLSIENGTFMGEFKEEWPAILRSRKSLRYSGQGINSLEYAGNNLDYAGSSLLYNNELSKDSGIDMLITRMNATVQGISLAPNDTVLSAQFMPTKETHYSITMSSTGIADFKYGFSSPNAELKKSIYPMASEGEERYYGNYNITRSIHMKSDFPRYEEEDDWISCCSAGVYEIGLPERKALSLP
ncbi:MAG: hypothetical protein M0Q89_08260 [Methanothrix soehngenii]|jgi:hypothetical protein|nr:hypothetical protein [Methanothrix soehngenii]